MNAFQIRSGFHRAGQKFFPDHLEFKKKKVYYLTCLSHNFENKKSLLLRNHALTNAANQKNFKVSIFNWNQYSLKLLKAINNVWKRKCFITNNPEKIGECPFCAVKVIKAIYQPEFIGAFVSLSLRRQAEEANCWLINNDSSLKSGIINF